MYATELRELDAERYQSPKEVQESERGDFIGNQNHNMIQDRNWISELNAELWERSLPNGLQSEPGLEQDLGLPWKRGGAKPQGRVYTGTKTGWEGGCVWITSKSFSFIDLAEASVAFRWSLCGSKVGAPDKTDGQLSARPKLKSRKRNNGSGRRFV